MLRIVISRLFLVVLARFFLPKTRFRASGTCVVCGAGLIGFERSYCRDCRLELSVLWRVNVRRKFGLPR
jgi:hypothetical protein